MHYDDGESEVLNLWKERVRVLELPSTALSPFGADTLDQMPCSVNCSTIEQPINHGAPSAASQGCKWLQQHPVLHAVEGNQHGCRRTRDSMPSQVDAAGTCEKQNIGRHFKAHTHNLRRDFGSGSGELSLQHNNTQQVCRGGQQKQGRAMRAYYGGHGLQKPGEGTTSGKSTVRGNAAVQLSGYDMLVMLGCKSAKQAQQMIDGMERRQVQVEHALLWPALPLLNYV